MQNEEYQTIYNVPVDFELPINENGRHYHIDCGRGDIAPYILTCGDPARARRIAGFFEKIEVRHSNREFVTVTGSYKGVPVSAMATGIGTDNSAIAIVEASQCVDSPTFIRVGSCGAIQDFISVGDLVITETALRDEKTTEFYANPDFEARADADVLDALIVAAKELRVAFHVGTTCTTSDFYAGQGRKPTGFPARDPEKIERMRKQGVLNFEMEMSAYLTLAGVSTYNIKAGGVCAVYDNMVTRSLATRPAMRSSELNCIKTGLRAVELLHGAS